MAKIKTVVCEELGFRQQLDGEYTPEQVRDALSQIMPFPYRTPD